MAGPVSRGEGEASVSGALAEGERKAGLGTAYGEQRHSSVRGTPP